MGDFNEAVTYVLKREGGYVDNAKDPGGATNFGISLRLLRNMSTETLKKCGIFHEPSELTPDHVREITVDQAKLVYKFMFWEQAWFKSIENQDECNYIFDMAVLHGTTQAIKLVQRAIWDCYEKREYAGLLDDGILGNDTLFEIDSLGMDIFRLALIGERIGYVRLIAHEKGVEKEFLNGWIDRCYQWY